MLFGIMCGLVAALFQCTAYLYSKRFIQNNGNCFQLLFASHLIMGIISSIGLGVLLLKHDIPPVSTFWYPLLKVVSFYLSAQFCFFLALNKTEASRLAPLLGLKILFLAALGILIFNHSLLPLQWVAVFLCLIGAVMSNWSGSAIPLPAIIYILLACFGYSLSDLNIKVLIDTLLLKDRVIGTLIAAGLSYFTLGGISLIAFIVLPQVKVSYLKPAAPFAVSWLIAMVLLFGCFGLIGPLFGNIVQSSRGIMAVVIGIAIAKFADSTLEQQLTKQVMLRRITAAIFITAAIILYAVAEKPTF
ncbi:EamA family transporter [Lentisphaerota bacterium ZTH]|nr:EamA family transporter [Lentisphaerota bacterium]WET06196.1 EamA family transporter [Lentisphaerota bacterium ZTH]